VTADERERLQPKITKFLEKTDLPRLYEEALQLVGATWEPNSGARAEADERQDAFVSRALKGAVPELRDLIAGFLKVIKRS
jgi:hypothetical protein